MAGTVKEKDKYTLYEMRKLSGLSASEIMRECNVSHQSLRNWEKAEVEPSIVTIYKLLNLYGFSFDQLNIEPFLKKNKLTHVTRHY